MRKRRVERLYQQDTGANRTASGSADHDGRSIHDQPPSRGRKEDPDCLRVLDVDDIDAVGLDLVHGRPIYMEILPELPFERYP